MVEAKNQFLNKRIYTTIIIFFVTVIAYQYSYKIYILYQKKQLKSSTSRKIIFGKIREIKHVTKSTRKWISYEFIYENKIYSNKNLDIFISKCNLEYDKKSFPILIDTISPQMNFILFNKRDYVYFGYKIPDSMNSFFNCIKPSGSYIFSIAPISPDY